MNQLEEELLLSNDQNGMRLTEGHNLSLSDFEKVKMCNGKAIEGGKVPAAPNDSAAGEIEMLTSSLLEDDMPEGMFDVPEEMEEKDQVPFVGKKLLRTRVDIELWLPILNIWCINH